ncbi:hypothetical protein BDR07DRAFT_1441368, partial [Suillus spraguei]
SLIFSISLRLEQYPSWFYCMDNMIVHILSTLPSLSFPSATWCLRPKSSVHSGKGNHSVQKILRIFQTVRSKFCALSSASPAKRLSACWALFVTSVLCALCYDSTWDMPVELTAK